MLKLEAAPHSAARLDPLPIVPARPWPCASAHRLVSGRGPLPSHHNRDPRSTRSRGGTGGDLDVHDRASASHQSSRVAARLTAAAGSPRAVRPQAFKGFGGDDAVREEAPERDGELPRQGDDPDLTPAHARAAEAAPATIGNSPLCGW